MNNFKSRWEETGLEKKMTIAVISGRKAGAHRDNRLAVMGSRGHDFTAKCLIRTLTCLVVKGGEFQECHLSKGFQKECLDGFNIRKMW